MKELELTSNAALTDAVYETALNGSFLEVKLVAGSVGDDEPRGMQPEYECYHISYPDKKGLSRFLAGIIFYTREVLLTSHYEKRLFEHASQPRVACADIRLLSYLWSRTNLSRDPYQSG